MAEAEAKRAEPASPAVELAHALKTLSLMHEDVRAIRGEHGAILELQAEALRHVAETQAQHGQALAEILRRLPPVP